MEKMKLPKSNQLGFYEMRFEAVGGLGANLAGQLLAQALVLKQGLNGSHFSSYGSEKKGSPVKSYVRVCPSDTEVRTSSPVERPHLLAIFHDCLLKVEGVVSGLYPDSAVVINSAEPVDDVHLRAQAGLTTGTLGVVNALAIAVQENTRINTAMLGAIARLAGFIDLEAVKDVIAESFGDRYPQLVKPNVRTFERGYEEVNVTTFEYDERFEAKPLELHKPYVHALGYANAPMGGAILNPGNTVYKDLSASRQGIFPLFHRDLCIDCGLCTQTCPDYVFVWEKGLDRHGQPAMVLKGPNLQYCKGCLKCVDICPVVALTEECERPEFRYTADVQLWGPPDALVTKGRDNEPAKWGQEEGNYWRRVG